MDRFKRLMCRHDRKYPLIAVVAGSGQVVRYAVDAGADIILALNAGVYRNLGAGSLASFMPYGNANDQTEALLRDHVLPHSGTVPVIAGVLSCDPTRDTAIMLNRLKDLGIAGVVNWPTMGVFDGELRRLIEFEGVGLESEIAMLRQAHEIGLVIFGFALEEGAVPKFIECGVDALILNVGLTYKVEDIRAKRDLLQHAISRLNGMLKAAKHTRKAPLCLAFGGPITTVEDLEELFRHSSVDGFAGGSVFERLPVQNIITSTVRHFKSIRLHPAPSQAQDDLGGMIGKSSLMQELFESIRRIAPYDVNVCIEGESGTGKELVATQLHRLSNRCRQRFVAMNCGAIPDSLLEGELFGNEKGAFTGADRRRFGKFELANHGTLFLDEIADLSLRGQVALLRVIQQREIARIGGDETIPVNVRIVAASNRSLSSLVEQGAFRNDLYYRLNNITLFVPALRDHKEDMAMLVDFILSRLRIQLNRKLVGLSAAFYEALAQHSWPGNVRELEHVICRAALLEDGPVLEGKHFRPIPEFKGSVQTQPSIQMHQPSKQWRNTVLRRALEDAGGNKSRVASRLGISRKTLYNWIKKL